jgi:hypothetical protein
MKILGCFLVLSFILIAVPAQANDVTLFGGLQHQGKLTLRSGVQSASTVTFDPRNFGVFGVRVGHGKVFGGEHTLAYAPNFVESQRKAIIYNSNVLIQMPLPKVKPYATAGLGAIFTSGDNIRDFGNKFAINYGGGLKIMPSGAVGGRIDVRGYTVPDIKTQTLSVSQTLNVIEVSVGVVFSF